MKDLLIKNKGKIALVLLTGVLLVVGKITGVEVDLTEVCAAVGE